MEEEEGSRQGRMGGGQSPREGQEVYLASRSCMCVSCAGRLCRQVGLDEQ